LENAENILKNQSVWENLVLPKDYHFERQLSSAPMIIFVIMGKMSLKINGETVYSVFSNEMFFAHFDNFYEITVLEQTHLIVCYAPIEAWYAEQKWMDNLVLDDKDALDEEFFKLPIKKGVIRFLSLLEFYLKEGIHSPDFFELKRQELFFLIFFFYDEKNLVRFLRYILTRDLQFKRFVIKSFSNARNVQELAKLANYSTSGFIKKFQKCFNESPYKWMQRQKAKQISIDINRGIKSLQEIANDHKFLSYQHFSIFCKAQLGAPPTAIFEKNMAKSE